MENVEEDQIDAARFAKHVQEMWQAKTKQDRIDAFRVAIFLLYEQGMNLQDLHPYDSEAGVQNHAFDDHGVGPLISRMERARDRLGLRPNSGISLPSATPYKLEGVERFVAREFTHEKFLSRIDYLVEQLATSAAISPSNLRAERFVSKFVGSWVGREPDDVIDLNSTSTGEVTLEFAPDKRCFSVELDDVFAFEVLMRVHSRGLTYEFENVRSQQDLQRFGIVVASRSAGRIPPSEAGVPSTLLAASWLASNADHRQRAAILLNLREAQSAAYREVRRRILASGMVRGVVELPNRASTDGRSLLLLLGHPSFAGDSEETVFLDGRALDGLQDESLDALAAFSSIPFRHNMAENEYGHRITERLSESLVSRAMSMFSSSRRQVDGFYCRANVRSDVPAQFSLVPAAWVPKREDNVVTSKLDPEPIHALLDGALASSTYVIGDNGAGKSFLLRDLIGHCLNRGRKVRSIASSHSDRFPRRLKHPGYRYLGVRTGTQSTSMTMLNRHAAQFVHDIHRDPGRLSVWAKISAMLDFEGKEFLMPASEDSTFIESIRAFDEVEGDTVPKGWRLGLQRRARGTITPFDHLSAGEQQVLLLTVKLVAESDDDVVFLIDEPETSLHVSWQRTLPRIFTEIRDSFGSSFVVATHSPVLISSATSELDARFSAQGGLLERLSLEGSNSVERILFEGFDTYTDSNREVHERCAELVAASVGAANRGHTDKVQEAIEELHSMQRTIQKSVLSLGLERTAPHQDLVENAITVLEKLVTKSGRLEVSDASPR